MPIFIGINTNQTNYINMKLSNLIATLILLFVMSFGIHAQSDVVGTVTDSDNGETLIGVNIYIDGTVKGTITDLDGNYEIRVDQTPSVLVFSLVGYEKQRITIDGTNSTLNVQMNTEAFMANEVVVSASRIEESILESPVTVEKLDLTAIKQSASADYYDEITRLKGVAHTQASLTFNSINARGFAGHGNTRFVQLQDGIDNAAPLLNFPTGSIVGISDLDIKNVELIPGASSALYGPNAFNGILLMTSKNPFDYPGLSAQIKTGFTDGNTVDPMYGATIRYAKSFNDKFAFKINASTLWAQDWEANDYDNQRSKLTFGDLSPDDVAFDGVNLYGDEVRFDITGSDGVPVTFTRKGLPEHILLESRRAESFKFGGAAHYKFSENLETNFSYQWGSGSSVYQGSERYALRDLVQQFIKWELNGDKWNIRAYASLTDAGDSYNLTALGTLPYTPGGTVFTDVEYNGQTLTLPYTEGYGVALNLAMNGALQALLGINPNDPQAATAFADKGGTNLLTDSQKVLLAQGLGEQFLTTVQGLIANAYPNIDAAAAAQAVSFDWATALVSGAQGPSLIPDSQGNYDPALADAIADVRQGLFQSGGASFIDDSGLYHVEGNYDLSSLTNDAIGLQAGGNWRLYSLFTDGTVFNEDFDGDGISERINISEFGAYLQATKRVANDKLKIGASIRYDKNENFEGQISPRLSLVYSLDEKRRHNLRTSFQTGFRNPTTQGQYIYFPTSSILLGGSRANAERYGIFEGGAWSEASFIRAAMSGDESLRETIFLDYVQPEQLRSFEIGYKGITNNKLFIDVNFYYNIYNSFIYQDNVVSKEPTTHKGNTLPAGTVFRPYFNAPVDIASWGTTFGADYVFSKNWKFSGNVTYNDFSFDETELPSGFEAFDPGFNTPTLRINAGLFNRKILDKLSFGANYRWQNEFEWIGSFGNGTIPSYSTVDAQVSYNLKTVNSTIKLGVNNILKNKYVTNYGGPQIGRIVYLTWTYDQMAN